MLKNIKSKLLILIIPTVILILVTSYQLVLNKGTEMLVNQINKQIEVKQESASSYFQQITLEFVHNIKTLSVLVESIYDHTDLKEYEEILKINMKDSNNLYGIGIWFEPYLIDKNNKFSSVYAAKNGNEIVITNIYGDEEFNYFEQPFYVEAKKTGQAINTGFYFEEISNMILITYSLPIFDNDENFIGCVNIDIGLDELQKIIKNYNSEDGWLYVIDDEGYYVGHEDTAKMIGMSNIFETENESLLLALDEVFNNSQGRAIFFENKEKYLLFYDDIPEIGWKTIFTVPESNLLKPIKIFTRFYILLLIALFGVIFFTIVIAIDIIIKKPINLLLEEFDYISANNYTTEIPNEILKRSDEFGSLGKSLAEMKQELKRYNITLEDLAKQNLDYAKEMKLQNKILKEKEKELTISNKYSEAIKKSMPDLLLIVSITGKCIECFGSEANLTVGDDYFIDKNIEKFFIPNNNENIIDKINESISINEMVSSACTTNINNTQEYFDLKISKLSDDRAVIIARNNTQFQNYLLDIEYLSYHDSLTGLYNRRYYDKIINELIVKKLFPICIIVSDLNNLKLINDSFGHEKGDLLIIRFSDILKKFRLANSYIARVGGDEFIILLPYTQKEAGSNLVILLEKECEKNLINNIPISAAFGVGLLENEDSNLNDTILYAEEDMYQKKMADSKERRDKTIRLISDTLNKKIINRQESSKRIATLCKKTAKLLDLTEEQQSQIYTAGYLRDIGKIGLSDDLINKNLDLTDKNYNLLNKHCEIGYRILKSSESFNYIADIIYSYKEKWDGTGVFRKLKGQEIPIESRIISIVEYYDYLKYIKYMNISEINATLNKYSGTYFEPELVDFFVSTL